MSLLSDLRKKYETTVKCENCGAVQMALIPKGVTKKEYLRKKNGICSNCGCNTLQEENSKGGQNETDQKQRSSKKTKEEKIRW